ncbi:MAG: HD domain-containing protein [Candidatus Woesebacteria bacterium]|nr:MAG: HD domain-containing protein [Candidatus Woesebacteria bacterium]
MIINLPAEVTKILEKFQDAHFEIYVVGGAVRDLLMGRKVDDWDFTTNATPLEIQKIFPESYYDNSFGTVGVAVENQNPYEITTFRTEDSYSDKRRPDKVSWGKTLEEDLKRRDFTINAMAIDPSLRMIDLYKGKEDLKNKLIRAVGDPHECFSEDALRMMRAIRIASELHFQIDEKTWDAIKDNSFLIDRISRERVRDELLKIVVAPYPDHGILLLKDSGLLRLILPELEKGFGVEQKSIKRHHIYDVGTHSVMSLKYCKSNDPITRFATLIHDIGKPQTFKKLESGVITFYNHEVVGAHIAKRIAERLRFSRKDSDKLYKLVRWHQFSVGEGQTDSAIRRFIRHVGLENVSDMLDLRVADRLGGGATETSWRLEEFKKRLVEVQKQPFSVHDLKIDGVDVMKELGIKPGPKVGEILNSLFKEVEEKKIENERQVLLKQLSLLRHQ